MERDSRSLLAEAIREEKQLNCCARHARTVWFDENICPCCKLIEEVIYGKQEVDSVTTAR